MVKLFRYLLLLSNQQFWGEIRIRMKGGRFASLKAEQEWNADTLPQPVPGTADATLVAHEEQQLREVFAQAAKRGVS